MAISGRNRVTAATTAQAVQQEKDRVDKDLSRSKVIETRVVIDVDTTLVKTKRYIDGSKWSVTYFNQLTSKSDVIGTLDISLSASEQQYVKITNLDINVTSPIESAKLSEITGEATVTEFLPIVGDFFSASLIGGINALFEIIEVTDKSYNLDRVYDVSFKLDSTDISSKDKIKSLDARVVRNLYYDKDSIYTGSDPLLIQDDINFKYQLERAIPKISDKYVQMFKNLSKRNILVLTIDGVSIVDNIVSELFNKITNRKYQLDFIENPLFADTIAGIIINDTPEYLKSVVHMSYGAVPSGANYDYRFRSLIGLNVDFIVKRYDGSPRLEVLVPSNEVLPQFKASDTSYLFSTAFYNQKSGLSLIEELLTDIMNFKTLSASNVKKLLDASYQFTVAESYLYIPFVLLIMQYAIMTNYSKGL